MRHMLLQKSLKKSVRCITEALIISYLNLNKCFSSSIRSYKLTIMGHDSAEYFYKLSIEDSKSVETSHLMDDLRFWPFLNGSQFF